VFACYRDKKCIGLEDARAYTYTLSQKYARTHACTHARTHASTQARTQASTQTCTYIHTCIGFLTQAHTHTRTHAYTQIHGTFGLCTFHTTLEVIARNGGNGKEKVSGGRKLTFHTSHLRCDSSHEHAGWQGVTTSLCVSCQHELSTVTPQRRVTCMLTRLIYFCTRKRTHTRTRTQTHAHAHTLTYAHAHTRAHTNTRA